MRQSRSYGALHDAHGQFEELHPRLEPQSRQPRNYDPVRETQYQADERLNARHVEELHSRLEPQSRQPRNYEALRETQQRVDDRQAEQELPDRPVQRSWTHRGGMVPQQESAITWIRQNHEIRMAKGDNTGAERAGEGAPQPTRDQNDPELQEARAAVEEARRREAAERQRLQERERGPER